MNLIGPRLPSSSGVMPGRGVLQHRQGVQRDVRAGPGVRRRRQVVGVGFAGHLEDGDGQAFRHFRTAGEPFGVGPALQHGLCVGVALVGQFLDVVELIEHQQRFLQRVGGHGGHFGVGQQLDQRLDVVAAQHRAEQFGGAGARDQRAGGLALGHGGQEACLDVGRLVHAGRHAVGDQVEQDLLFASRRILQQLDQFGGLLSRQRQGRDAERGACGRVNTKVFKHGRPAGIGVSGTACRACRGCAGHCFHRNSNCNTVDRSNVLCLI